MNDVLQRGLLMLLCGALSTLSAIPIQAAPPKLTSLFPAGAQRGQSVVVTAAGEFPAWPVEAHCDRAGVTIVAEKERGQFRVTIAADALPGLCWWRAVHADGVSSPRPFLIDQLPEINETEPNNAPEKTPEVTLPVIVNGRLAKNGDVDGYLVQLKQGESLVARVQANWQLGSPMDAFLQICECVERPPSSALPSAARQVEAFVVAQDHDTQGLDPLLMFTAPRAGNYLVRVMAFPSEPNGSIAFAGGDAYIYRLTLTKGGLLDHPFPLSVPREATDVAIAGWNLPPNASRASLPAVENPTEQRTRMFSPEFAGAVDVARVAWPGKLATEAAKSSAGEQLTLPTLLSARFDHERETHTYRFTAKKGERWQLELTARELGLPLDGVLTVLDAQGKQLQTVDDAKKQTDPELTFAASADGEYQVQVRDLHDRGGWRFVYQLRIAPVSPTFALTVAADAFVLTADKPLEIPVTIDRRDGFKGEIQITATGLPPGVTIEAATSTDKGDSTKAVKLLLRSAPAAPTWQGPIAIVGTSKEGEQTTLATYAIALPGVAPPSAVWLTQASSPTP
ncbi:MAG TPA: PPC domain-containing protein [Pirellulaceae bacterium]|nr:PPC domain-containing protein [Pirellulaceae bacterium]